MELVAEQKTSQTLKVERARPEDQAALVEMYLDFEPKGAALGLPPRKDPGAWLTSLSEFPNFVVKAAGRVIGHAALCIEGDKGETAIFVHQAWRSRGVGRMLLSELIAEGRRHNLRRVWGMAAPDNFVMLRLADSLGFVPGHDPGVFHLDLIEHNAKQKPSAASAA
jgi:GNAT superfamily N-acetyltransferase